MDIKTDIKDALKRLGDGGIITEACLAYTEKTNETCAVVSLLKVRELLTRHITNAMHSDGESSCVCSAEEWDPVPEHNICIACGKPRR